VTTDELARSYLAKARVRLKVLDLLMAEEAWSDVVREAQELVELALKGMLRQVGIDPPRWHDVGPVLIDASERFPEAVRAELPIIAEASRWLRKERELAFYGEVDVIPTRAYGRPEAERALDDARRVFVVAERLIAPA